MSIFGKLARALFGGGGAGRSGDGSRGDGGNAFWLYVRCRRCGEAIRARVDRNQDLAPDLESGDPPDSYLAHKEIMGRNPTCFQRIGVDLTFDASKRESGREIRGGEFITREDYEAASAGAAPAAS